MSSFGMRLWWKLWYSWHWNAYHHPFKTKVSQRQPEEYRAALAGSCGNAGAGRLVCSTTIESFCWSTAVVRCGSCCRTPVSNRDHKSKRKPFTQSAVWLHPERHSDCGYGDSARAAYICSDKALDTATGTVDFCCCFMDSKLSGVCFMVLAPRCRWATRTRSNSWSHRWCIFVSADDDASWGKNCCGWATLGTKFHRLSVPRIQYKHRILANRCARTITLGKDTNDDSSDHFFGCDCFVGRSCGEHTLRVFRHTLKALADFPKQKTQPFWGCA